MASTGNASRRPHPQQTARIISVMAFGEVRLLVSRTRGPYLRDLFRAAEDVAKSSEWHELRVTAQEILEAGQALHPGYFDQTPHGAS